MYVFLRRWDFCFVFSELMMICGDSRKRGVGNSWIILNVVYIEWRVLDEREMIGTDGVERSGIMVGKVAAGYN